MHSRTDLLISDWVSADFNNKMTFLSTLYQRHTETLDIFDCILVFLEILTEATASVSLCLATVFFSRKK